MHGEHHYQSCKWNAFRMVANDARWALRRETQFGDGAMRDLV
jgi:hypothetical protein